MPRLQFGSSIATATCAGRSWALTALAFPAGSSAISLSARESQLNASCFRRMPWIPNGSSRSAGMRYRRPRPPYFGFLSLLVRQRGVHILVEAFNRLLQNVSGTCASADLVDRPFLATRTHTTRETIVAWRALVKRISIELLPIALIVSLSVLLRVWGVNYDLPYIYHPDEPEAVIIAHRIFVTGDFNPHFFDWPSFTIYTNLFVQAAYHFLSRLLALEASTHIAVPAIQIAMGAVLSPQPAIVLLGRMVTIGFGIGTVLITIWLGKALTRSLAVGLLAGMMVAVSPTNVSLNRFITPDSYATFFILASFFASLLIFQQGKTMAYLLAGICSGLAISSKYNSGLILIVFLACHFLRYGTRGFRDYRLYLTLFLSFLAFVAATPYALLDFPTFWAAFLSTSQHYSTGHPGMEGNTLQWYVMYMRQTGGVIYILALLGILRGMYLRSKEVLLLSLFPLVYFVFISSFVVRNDRTSPPLTPFLFLLAAWFLVDLFDRVKKFQSRFYRRLILTVLVSLTIITLAFPLSKTIADTRRLTTVNSRETARIWIADNLPPGTKVAIESYSPFVDPSRFFVQGFGRMIEHESAWYIEQGFDYLVFSQGIYGRFYEQSDKYRNEVSQYDALFERFHLMKDFTDGNYEVRVYEVEQADQLR